MAEVINHLTHPPHHHLRVSGSRGAVALDVSLELTAPWTLIFGPSGSGKSSLLRAACGLLRDLRVELRRWDAPAKQWIDLQTAQHNTPTAARGLGYAPQGAAVFPHLTVRQNIEFALTSRGLSGSSHLAEAAIELFSLGPLLHRMPRELSGGERQGVSLARAFAVPNPRLILLDEPFSGIDRSMRDALLPRMRDHLASLGVPALSVTHDVEEALLLGAEVIRIDEGKVLTRGPAAQVLNAECVRMSGVLNLAAEG